MLHQADMSSLAVDSLLKQLARDRQAIFKAAVDWQSVLNQLLTRRFKPMSCRGPDFLAVRSNGVLLNHEVDCNDVVRPTILHNKVPVVIVRRKSVPLRQGHLAEALVL